MFFKVNTETLELTGELGHLSYFTISKKTFAEEMYFFSRMSRG